MAGIPVPIFDAGDIDTRGGGGRPWGAALRRARTLLAALLLVAATAIPASFAAGGTAAPAQGRPGPALSAKDAEDIARIERYLNSIRTMTARFLQSTSDGRYAEGKLYLSRPGKLRIEYDPPVPILIVSDGTWVHYFDSELNQVNRLRLSETPASVLVRQRLGIGDAVRVTSFRRGAGTLRVTLEDIANPDAGRLTLTFSDRPLILRQWSVLDAQGVETKVALYDNLRDMPLSPKLFRFERPRRSPAPFGP